MTQIKIIQPEEAQGELKAIYEEIIKKRGKIAQIHKIQSLNPKSIVNHMDFYLTLLYGQSPLKRAWREMIAVVVSKANDCEYCQIHHLEALNHFWKDDSRANSFMIDYKSVDLSETEQLLCEYAQLHTKFPGEDKSEIIEKLKKNGLDDRGILDATLIIGYFNFVNRIVTGLGVEVEPEGADGYYFE